MNTNQNYDGKPSTVSKLRKEQCSKLSDGRVCNHWECDLAQCLYAISEEGERKSQGPLHHDSAKPSTLPAESEKSQFSAKNLPRISNASTISSRSSTASLGRTSLGGFFVGGKPFESLIEMGEDGADDRSLHSGLGSVSSAEYKIMVHNVQMVDNTDQSGLYSGSLDKRIMKPHGKGTMVYAECIYEGQWVNGDWCGFGKLTDINGGDVYEGGFFDNMKHGLGVMKYADGRIYDGMFTLDKIDGKGRLTDTDGTKYWGYWSREGVPHGRGKKEYPDGKVYDGEFQEGVIAGHGRMTFPDGTWYLGEWSDGLPNGLGMKVDATGDLLFEGLYSNGEPIEGSSMRHEQKSSGQFLLYRSSVTPYGGGTLVGPLPRHMYMRQRMDWTFKNL